MPSKSFIARHVPATGSWVLGFLILAAMPALAEPVSGADRELIPDTSLPVPPLHFDSTGALAIAAGPAG